MSNRPQTKLRLGVALRFECAGSAAALAPHADRERLVVEYWYLCRRGARRFLRRGLDRADLEQVAAIGLIKAVDRYDAAQAAPFEAYAWILVLGELMHFVRDSERVIRAPRSVRELERRWSAAERHLWMALGREPTDDDVARCAGISPAHAGEVRLFRESGKVVSFELLGDAEERTLGRGIDEVLDRLTVEHMLHHLLPLEREIVSAIHLEGASVVEVARRLGYSRRHLTRLHRGAIERLRSVVE